MKRALPFTVTQKAEYARRMPDIRLTTQQVARFRSICREGMELRGIRTRSAGFGCGEVVYYGNEEERVVPMRIVKIYKNIALMDDGHCQRWEDLALLNMNLE